MSTSAWLLVLLALWMTHSVSFVLGLIWASSRLTPRIRLHELERPKELSTIRKMDFATQGATNKPICRARFVHRSWGASQRRDHALIQPRSPRFCASCGRVLCAHGGRQDGP